MQIKTAQDLFVHLLSDTYSAEKQLTRALPKLARAASDEKLAAAFRAHLEETRARLNASTRWWKACLSLNCAASNAWRWKG